MKTKMAYIAGVAIIAFASFAYSQAAQGDPPEAKAGLEQIQGENEQLKAKIAELNKTIDSLKIEIARLNSLCKANNIDTSPQEKVVKLTSEALSQPMFGIFLGETIDSLKKRMKVEDSGVNTEELGLIGKMWGVHVDNPSVKRMLAVSFQNLICSISIDFVDGSESNYDAIKKQLEKKYGAKENDDFSETLSGKSVFKPVIDGVVVLISLDYDAGFLAAEKLNLSYSHLGIGAKLTKELERRKAAKVKSDL